ncbi:hypothetical protein [Erwinia persicina]|uniref:hypothetical protein n=1 Tax=Erwinia persicina TaxID=55211 RepID=UPI00177FAF64|nr:hypothetical protein [Erwinia persicina]MBD8165175.1 hypothetical protein [Erwinia persicina]MBD8215938.1 hypothetical protein [Erwinia persicina]
MTVKSRANISLFWWQAEGGEWRTGSGRWRHPTALIGRGVTMAKTAMPDIKINSVGIFVLISAAWQINRIVLMND